MDSLRHYMLEKTVYGQLKTLKGQTNHVHLEMINME